MAELVKGWGGGPFWDVAGGGALPGNIGGDRGAAGKARGVPPLEGGGITGNGWAQDKVHLPWRPFP